MIQWFWKVRVRLVLAIILPMALAGCGELAYYWQAGMGQLEILRKRRPIEEVLSDKTVSEEVKAKLALVTKVQTYGETTLALPESVNFKYYADLEREYVTWLVVASEAYAIQEFKNCYLIVGCLGYRGYFEREDANSFASELSEEGYDVLVRPVQAYSTLGWFDDPILNTSLHSSDINLISTIIHEQAHRVIFVKNDTTFNESFATFVEEEGVRQFLNSRGDEGQAQLEMYLSMEKEREIFHKILRTGRERLEKMYSSNISATKRKAEKARLFDLLRQDYQKEKSSFKIMSYDGWFQQDLNNAHLVGIQQYHSRVEAFRVLFEEEERDFTGFFRRAKELAELPEEEREAMLKALEEKNLAKN